MGLEGNLVLRALTKRLIQMCTALNCTTWKQQSIRSVHNWTIQMMLSYIIQCSTTHLLSELAKIDAVWLVLTKPKFLYGKNVISWKICKNFLEEFFAPKIAKFYTDGIMKLPKIWLKVIEKNICIYWWIKSSLSNWPKKQDKLSLQSSQINSNSKCNVCIICWWFDLTTSSWCRREYRFFLVLSWYSYDIN